jgi:hypothetical protein
MKRSLHSAGIGATIEVKQMFHRSGANTMAMLQWLLLLPQIPSSPSSLRVAIWRRMRAAGAVSLQHGVWVLPLGTDQERTARELQAEVSAAGGTVLAMTSSLLFDGDDEFIVNQFRSDRDQDYAEFRERCSEFLKELQKESAQQTLTYAELEENEEDLRKLTTWLSKIRARDFFSGCEGQRACDDLVACQQALEAYATSVYAREGMKSGADHDQTPVSRPQIRSEL